METSIWGLKYFYPQPALNPKSEQCSRFAVFSLPAYPLNSPLLPFSITTSKRIARSDFEIGEYLGYIAGWYMESPKACVSE